MKNLILILAVGVLSLQSTYAQWWNSDEIDGNGNLTTVSRRISDYDQVALEGAMDVELVSGKEGDLKVEAEENLMDYIMTQVDGETLEISVKKGYNLNPSKKILITVPFEDLNAVFLTGSGDINSNVPVNAENLEVKITGSGNINLPVTAKSARASITGSGDIVLKGSARDFDCSVTGSGDISAFQFRCESVDATVTGSGDIEVYASKELRAKTPGSGDITYKGNPEKEDFKTMGSGDITKK